MRLERSAKVGKNQVLAYIDRLASVLIPVMLLMTGLTSFGQNSVQTVTTVAWNYAGTRLALGFDSGVVEVVDPSMDKVVQSFQFLGSVDQVSWSRIDESLLAAVTNQIDSPGVIHILDVSTGQEIAVLTGKTGQYVAAITWKPDGTQIAAANNFVDDPTSLRYISIWDTASGRLENSVEFTNDDINTIEWNPDGTLLAHGGVDQLVTVWDPETETVLDTIAGHH